MPWSFWVRARLWRAESATFHNNSFFLSLLLFLKHVFFFPIFYFFNFSVRVLNLFFLFSSLFSDFFLFFSFFPSFDVLQVFLFFRTFLLFVFASLVGRCPSPLLVALSPSFFLVGRSFLPFLVAFSTLLIVVPPGSLGGLPNLVGSGWVVGWDKISKV